MYCRQKPELLHFNMFIEARSPITGKVRKDQLKVWLEVEDYDAATGSVLTRAGIWQKEDLEFIGKGVPMEVVNNG